MELLSPVGSLNGPAFAVDSKSKHFSLKPMPIRARLWADWLSTGLSPGPRQSQKPRCPPAGVSPISPVILAYRRAVASCYRGTATFSHLGAICSTHCTAF